MNIIKLFFAFVLVFVGLLILPFAVIGGTFGAPLVLLLGGGTVYIIYLLFTDDFAPLSPLAEQKAKQIALVAAPPRRNKEPLCISF